MRAAREQSFVKDAIQIDRIGGMHIFRRQLGTCQLRQDVFELVT